MDVTGAPLQRGEDGGIDQPDDGAGISLSGQLLDRDGFVAAVVIADDIKNKTFAGFFEHALRLLGLLRMSLIWESVATLVTMRLPRRRPSSSIIIKRLG